MSQNKENLSKNEQIAGAKKNHNNKKHKFLMLRKIKKKVFNNKDDISVFSRSEEKVVTTVNNGCVHSMGLIKIFSDSKGKYA